MTLNITFRQQLICAAAAVIATMGIACTAVDAQTQTVTSALVDPTQGDAIIAQVDGAELRDSHFLLAIEIEMAERGISYMSIGDQILLRSQLIEMFRQDPQTMLAALQIYQNQKPGGVVGSQDQGAHSGSQAESGARGIAAGHSQMRTKLIAMAQSSGSGANFSAQAFDTPSVNQLRSYMANSQLIHRSSDQYYSGSSTYTFCADGTFRFAKNSSMSVGSTLPGNGGYETGRITGSDQAAAHGIWDTYTEAGNDAVVMFSADQGFAEESMNYSGLLAMPVASYQVDVLQFGPRGLPATADNLLRRQAIAGCQ